MIRINFVLEICITWLLIFCAIKTSELSNSFCSYIGRRGLAQNFRSLRSTKTDTSYTKKGTIFLYIFFFFMNIFKERKLEQRLSSSKMEDGKIQ